MRFRPLQRTVRLAVVILLTGASLFAQSEIKRPRILGIAHVAFYVGDLNRTRAFYKDFLGFDEPFSLKHPDGTDWIGYMKVNDHQYLELFAGDSTNRGQLAHIAIYTDNAVQMKDYLQSRGIEPVAKLHQGQTGDYFFSVADPDDHLIEIVEYRPNSWTAREKGNFMPSGRISNRILRAGLMVRSTDRALKFYRDVLGFQQISGGSTDQTQTTRVGVRVPNGDDSLELIVYPGHPSLEQQKAQDRVCLERANLSKTMADLHARVDTVHYSYPMTVHTESNRPPSVDLFDPDGVHVELIEPANSTQSANPGLAAR
jgi:lactoylglutathione lyase